MSPSREHDDFNARLFGAFRWFCIDTHTDTLRELCTMVYQDLLGTTPTAKLILADAEHYPARSDETIGVYIPLTHTCWVRREQPRRQIVCVMGHELGHAYVRDLIATPYGEARVELFELAFCTRILERIGIDCRMPLPEDSFLAAFEDELRARTSHDLLELFIDFDTRRSEVGLDWSHKWLWFVG